MSLANTSPDASSTTTPHTCVVFVSTAALRRLAGLSPAGGTKYATSFGARGSDASTTRTPSLYHD
jgi:hypothetical protein